MYIYMYINRMYLKAQYTGIRIHIHKYICIYIHVQTFTCTHTNIHKLHVSECSGHISKSPCVKRDLCHTSKET